jgi:hypothetical protein
VKVNRVTYWIAGFGVMLLLTACAAGPNPEVGEGTQNVGFLLGVWHGLILPVTFVISLFADDVSIYEVHNSGHWYDFGFLLGAGGLALPGFLSGGRRSSRRR